MALRVMTTSSLIPWARGLSSAPVLLAAESYAGSQGHSILIMLRRGVRPWRWTESSGCFDRLVLPQGLRTKNPVVLRC